MTIDITPKTVLRMATGFEFDGDKTTATTLRALSAALTASQAETAAAYEAAVGAVRQADADCKGAYGACENIRALPTTFTDAEMLAAAMQLPEVRALIEALRSKTIMDPDNSNSTWLDAAARAALAPFKGGE
jgi:hypothetical protein